MRKTILEKLALLNRTTLNSLNFRNKGKTDITRSFAETAIEILEGDFGFVWYKFRDGARYELLYSSPSLPYDPSYPRRKGTNYRVQKKKVPLFITNVKKARFLSEDTKSHAKSVAVIPIFYQDNTYGNIVVEYKNTHKFTAEQRALATAVGNAAAQVLTIYRAEKRHEEQNQRLLKQKDDFIGVASHELKTPLTTIKGFAQLLQKYLSARDPQVRYFLGKINTQADRLTRLVGDLLDVSKIDAGKLNFEKRKVNVTKLMTEIVEAMQFTTDQHLISLNGKIRGWVLGDHDRLGQVFTNIIGNAIKYSPQGEEIVVRLRQNGPWAFISVQDFGIGIPRKFQSQIFEKFFQGGGIGAAFPGMGLGLFISREIVRRHGGEIWAESKKGEGTTFFVKLPRQKDMI